MSSIDFQKIFGIVVCGCLLTACGGGGSGGGTAVELEVQEVPEVPEVVVQSIPESQQRIIPTDEAFAYRSEAEFASVLKDCALADSENTCTLGALPFIGKTSDHPSVEDIMQRVVVTHDWMGARFEQMLYRMPADMLDLFGPVTAIVIGSEIRPSSYSSVRARINLDPRYLWLTVPEKRTIETAPDFRTDFGSALQFVSGTRLAIGSTYATTFSSLSDDNERVIEELDIPLADLLYHELAHANDFMRYTFVPDASDDLFPWQAMDEIEDSHVWRELYDNEQLTVQTSWLYGLAAVRFFDEEPSETLASMRAEFVGGEMANEGKAMFYGYSTSAEDVATLFAAAMMKYHYDVDYHVGFMNVPENEEEARCDDYKVAWGVRNRLAAPLVAPRAEFVVDRILRPSDNLDQFFAAGLGAETSLRLGAGWCESVSDDVSIAKQAENNRMPQELGGL